MNTELRALLAAVLLLAGLAACRQPEPAAGPDPAVLKRQMQQHTEELLRIHLRLDTAAGEIAQAEDAARDGNTSAAQFHAQEAYRNVEIADEALLELGRRLQEMVNLDIDG